jgi:hypothetical protein
MLYDYYVVYVVYVRYCLVAGILDVETITTLPPRTLIASLFAPSLSHPLLLLLVLAATRARRRWPRPWQRRQGPVRLRRRDGLPGRVWPACGLRPIGGWGGQRRVVLWTHECVCADGLARARAGRLLGGEGGGFQALVGCLEGFFEGFEFGGLGGDDALPGGC